MTPKAHKEVPVRKGRTLSGVVTSISMKDTITVAVSRYVKHPKYKKYLKRTKKYLVHAPGNTAALGDKATIIETRPISKNKHFALASITAGVAPLESMEETLTTE
jgi:small subunit ribosomal protein S17